MAEEYSRSISKQVVAQLAEREGFQLAHGNALDALADVLNRFIREIGIYAKDYAELQGRTDVNVLDLADGLQDLGVTPEVLLGQVKQEHAPDPFTHSVPEFPVRRIALQPPSFNSSGEAAPAHIPAHLPAFPAPHTMKFTQMPQLRQAEMKQQQQHDQAENPSEGDGEKANSAQESLISLHQRIQASSGAVRANPFLAFRETPKTSTDAEMDTSGHKSEGAHVQGVWLPSAVAAYTPAKDAAAGPGEVATARRRLSDIAGQDDDMHVRGSDEEPAADSGAAARAEAQPGGWGSPDVDEDVIMATTALYLGGSAPTSSLKDRYSTSRRDAFVDQQLVRDGAHRRRITLNNPESSKKLRAMDILDTGADAILMEYPEGYVPRQGTQRARDDVPG